MKSILDPTFEYTSSADTDIARTFARIRQAQPVVAEAQQVEARAGRAFALAAPRTPESTAA